LLIGGCPRDESPADGAVGGVGVQRGRKLGLQDLLIGAMKLPRPVERPWGIADGLHRRLEQAVAGAQPSVFHLRPVLPSGGHHLDGNLDEGHVDLRELQDV